MSIEKPSDDDKQREYELFDSLELYRLDPQLESIIEDMAVVDEEFSDASEVNNVYEQLELLNRGFETTNWIGTIAEISGKIRVAPWIETGDLYNAYLAEHGTRHEDEKGEYYTVIGVPFVITLIDVDTNDSDEDDEDESDPLTPPRTVFTFVSPDDMADAEDEDEVDQILENAGAYILYPTEIDEFVPREPSIAQIGLDLKHHYPELYARIMETVSPDAPAGHHVLGSLKQFEIPTDTPHLTPEIINQVAAFIFDRLGTDSEVPYEFTLDGEVFGMSVEEGLVGQEMNSKKLRGIIVGLEFVLVEDAYRARLIVSEDSIAYNDGVEGRIIPIDSITKLRSLRGKRKRFGETAMRAFDSPDEIAEYWREKHQSTPDYSEARVARETLPSDTTEQEFNDLISDIGEVAHFDERFDCFVVPVIDDIALITEDFDDHVRIVEAVEPDSPLTGLDYALIAKYMDKTMQRLSILHYGDKILVGGKAMILDANGEIDQYGNPVTDVLLTEDDTPIRGELMGIEIANIPETDLISEEADTFASLASSHEIALVVRTPEVRDEEGAWVPAPVHSEYVSIPLRTGMGSRFYKQLDDLA